MNDENKSNENEPCKIPDRQMNIETILLIVLFVSGFFIVSFVGAYLGLSDKSRRGVGFALIGLSFITSGNACAAVMNYSLPEVLSSIKFGPWYSRIIGAIIVLFSVIKIFV